MLRSKFLFWFIPLFGILFFVRCDSSLEEMELVSENEPRECFDYIYPIEVIFNGDTLTVSDYNHYKDLHARCDEIFSEFTPGLDPKGRDSNNRVPTGKGHSSSSTNAYGDCPRDNDPWCGEMIFPITIENVPGLEGEIIVGNDSTLQYYRWIVCD